MLVLPLSMAFVPGGGGGGGCGGVTMVCPSRYRRAGGGCWCISQVMGVCRLSVDEVVFGPW